MGLKVTAEILNNLHFSQKQRGFRSSIHPMELEQLSIQVLDEIASSNMH
jgi:hypothetical protein